MAHPAECQISNQVFGGVYCASFNCTRRAAYSIGRLIGPASLKMNLCEQCAVDLLKNCPPDLWGKAVEARAKEEQATLADRQAQEAAEREAKIEAGQIFLCSKCGAVFTNALNAKGHEKKCSGGGK